MIKYLWGHFLNTLKSERGDFGAAKSKAAGGISEAGSTMYDRGQMTPQETSQYQGSFDLGNIIKQIQMSQQGLGQAPQGYQTGEQQYQQGGPLAQSYYNQTLAGTQDPYGAFESTLQPSLTQAMDTINRQAQSRGLIRSGIPLEQGSRAAVELAIQEAQNRMNFRNQELARGGELSSYSQGLGQSNLANLSSLYGQQQQFGLNSLGRQAGQAQAAASYQAYPYQMSLGNVYGMQKGLMDLAGKTITAGGQVGAAMAAA